MLYRLSSLRVRLLMSKSIFSSRKDLQTSSFDFFMLPVFCHHIFWVQRSSTLILSAQ